MRLARRSGSMAEVTGIMVNSGTTTTAMCWGNCFGGSPNMRAGLLFEPFLRKFEALSTSVMPQLENDTDAAARSHS